MKQEYHITIRVMAEQEEVERWNEMDIQHLVYDADTQTVKIDGRYKEKQKE